MLCRPNSTLFAFIGKGKVSALFTDPCACFETGSPDLTATLLDNGMPPRPEGPFAGRLSVGGNVAGCKLEVEPDEDTVWVESDRAEVVSWCGTAKLEGVEFRPAETTEGGKDCNPKLFDEPEVDPVRADVVR